MKFNTLFLFLFFAFSMSCASSKEEIKTTSCLSNKVSEFDKKQECEHGVQVVKYFFQNQIVYVFDPGYCIADNTSEVIDSNCKTLGFLGGFVGNTSINGEDFSKAVVQDTIWQRK